MNFRTSFRPESASPRIFLTRSFEVDYRKRIASAVIFRGVMDFNLVKTVSSSISVLHLNILFLLGLALFGGTMGGRLFQKLKIPQVVGYIAIGIVVGQSWLNIVDQELIKVMEPFNYFALGLIGFMIGGELKKDVLVKYGKQFAAILFGEGLSAFLLVLLFVGLAGQLVWKNPGVSWGMGLILGAIASATAPAATTDVLWELRSKGPLTTTVLGIVALDDALALFLFAFSSSIAGKLMGQHSLGMAASMFHSTYEIFVSVLIGSASGYILTKILKIQTEKDKVLALSIGTVLLVLGLSLTLNVDVLLAAMTLGVVVVNRTPRISREVFSLVSGFTPPIYVLFFVLVGAKLNVARISGPVFLIAVVYLLGRTAGKMVGSRFGAWVSGAPRAVRDYLPFCLFSQAGVAIGLSIAAYHLFPGEIGNSVVLVITTTTFVVQLLGPSCTRFAVLRSKEAGLNITEEDMIRRSKASDVMDKNPPLVYQQMPLVEVLNIFKNNDYLYYPVVNPGHKLVGVITVESIRQIFMETEISPLLLACDLMEPVFRFTGPGVILAEVKEEMERYSLEYLPVTGADMNLVGFIERRMLTKFISTKMLELERRAASLE